IWSDGGARKAAGLAGEERAGEENSEADPSGKAERSNDQAHEDDSGGLVVVAAGEGLIYHALHSARGIARTSPARDYAGGARKSRSPRCTNMSSSSDSA